MNNTENETEITETEKEIKTIHESDLENLRIIAQAEKFYQEMTNYEPN